MKLERCEGEENGRRKAQGMNTGRGGEWGGQVWLLWELVVSNLLLL